MLRACSRWLLSLFLLDHVLAEGEARDPLAQSRVAHPRAQSDRLETVQRGPVPHHELRLLRVVPLVAEEKLLHVELLLVLLRIE